MRGAIFRLWSLRILIVMGRPKSVCNCVYGKDRWISTARGTDPYTHLKTDLNGLPAVMKLRSRFRNGLQDALGTSKDHQILIAWSICKDQSLILRPVTRAKFPTNFLICKSYLAPNHFDAGSRRSGLNSITMPRSGASPTFFTV